MTPYKFYDWFATFVESFPLIPIFLGIIKWKRLTLGIKLFLLFLLTDFTLNKIGDSLKGNNLFLHYYYSFFQITFILSMIFLFFEKKKEKSITLFLLIFGNFSLAIDFLFFSKIGYNYISGIIIDLIICLVAIYYFKNEFGKIENKNYSFIELYQIISLGLILQFFIKFIDDFLEKYLLETQNNALLWFQVKDIYYFFMLICLLVYSYAFYNFKVEKN